MPNVTGLSHVVLQCHDLDRMVSFYRQVLGLVVTHEREGRMVFMTANPQVEDHQIALAAGRRGEGSPLAHIAWHVATVEDVKAAYEQFKATGIPIDHTVSHAYATLGNTVSCYFRDPEGNLLEVFAMVDEADPAHRENRGLDLERSVDEIVAQASGLTPATVAH
jgi:catechol 2,3-dioxygenase-like lactoylglutathione lyase family enzyme